MGVRQSHGLIGVMHGAELIGAPSAEDDRSKEGAGILQRHVRGEASREPCGVVSDHQREVGANVAIASEPVVVPATVETGPAHAATAGDRADSRQICGIPRSGRRTDHHGGLSQSPKPDRENLEADRSVLGL